MLNNLRILIVHSKTKNIVGTFIQEQASSLEKNGVIISYFSIQKKGVLGYLSHLKEFKRKISEFEPNIIHAHYGLSGLFSNLQRKTPVVTTFHGSDIFNHKNRLFSLMAHSLSKESIFVSTMLKQKLGVKSGKIITCGVDLEVFKPNNAKRENYVLFSGSFLKKVKNHPLAKKSIDLYNAKNKGVNELRLVELVNNSREQVADLMNRAKALLITSHYEGSSQVLKEAMACNCPVITVKVGSVPDIVKPNSKAVIVVERNDVSILEAIGYLNENSYDQGRNEIISHNISIEQVAERLIQLYKDIRN